LKLLRTQCRQATLRRLDRPGTVPEYNEDPSTFGTKGVLNWYLDIVERDVRRSSSRRIASLDLRRLDTFTTFNENNCEPILGLASDGEVVCKAIVLYSEESHTTVVTESRTARW
jgi:hypothetical protein